MLRKAMPPAGLRLHDRVAYRLLRCTLGGGKGMHRARVAQARNTRNATDGVDPVSLVSHKRETTAAQLYEESREVDAVGATAWNNRLASLVAKSLVVEVLQGRTKKYRPVLKVA